MRQKKQSSKNVWDSILFIELSQWWGLFLSGLSYKIKHRWKKWFQLIFFLLKSNLSLFTSKFFPIGPPGPAVSLLLTHSPTFSHGLWFHFSSEIIIIIINNATFIKYSLECQAQSIPLPVSQLIFITVRPLLLSSFNKWRNWGSLETEIGYPRSHSCDDRAGYLTPKFCP